jgi:MFS family permease
MSLIENLRAKIAQWPYGLLSVVAAIAAFGTYTSMYAFRKAFASGTFLGQQYFHVDYKVWLVIAQVIGYTLSKFYGIKFIAELKENQRAKSIFTLIAVAWLSLLLFAFIPAPYNIICLLLNGFPLGMIWGLVFSYLEGRKSTEFMAAVLSISLIFASGFIKTVGRLLISNFRINEYWMPFTTGALFVVPLVVFVFFLELMPAPTPEDIKLRTKRLPMSMAERKNFLLRFLPGIILTLIIYVLLTVMRDVRDNFEVEIWASFGIKDNTIYTKTDTIISIIVLVAISLLILVKKNMKAFRFIHFMIISGCLLIAAATVLFNAGIIGPMVWMTLAGLGLYLGYVPYNAIFFERMIASFHYRSNVGFLMYVSDSLGYLASVSVLFVKEFGRHNISWAIFFKDGVLVVGAIGAVCAILSLFYFMQTAGSKNDQPSLDTEPHNIQTV